mmetsp:Transcript_109638/g.189937  ORF Transcript_109638/g.189937 Transcript_109638/m.189937 type:complete len:99 (+) Transcript_109638:112-408(+)
MHPAVHHHLQHPEHRSTPRADVQRGSWQQSGSNSVCRDRIRVLGQGCIRSQQPTSTQTTSQCPNHVGSAPPLQVCEQMPLRSPIRSPSLGACIPCGHH